VEILARFIGKISIYAVVDVVLGVTKLAKRNEISLPQYGTKKIANNSLLFLLIRERSVLQNTDHSGNQSEFPLVILDKFSI